MRPPVLSRGARTTESTRGRIGRVGHGAGGHWRGHHTRRAGGERRGGYAVQGRASGEARRHADGTGAVAGDPHDAEGMGGDGRGEKYLRTVL